MPFTFSHPAIVLPLALYKPRWFSVTGLVVGSMTPDFLYFIKMDGSEDFGHTLAGIFLFDLPVSYLLAIAFHRWVRNPFLVHLPAPLDRNYAGYLAFDFGRTLKVNWFVFPLSVLLGAFSHIGWDYCCDPRGWLYYTAPGFFSQYVSVAGIRLRVYLLIERIGSVVGLLLLGWAARRGVRPAAGMSPASARSKGVYWLGLLVSTLVFTGLRLPFDHDIHQLGQVVLVMTSAFCYAMGLVTALYTWLAGSRAGDMER